MKSNADDLVIKTNERVRWTEELHEIFVAAALKLGPKAVPSKVLAEMKCTVLTRDQVASHLQNYRPILFGKEEDSAKTKQQAPTKKVERKKRAPEPAKESAKEAPKKKQRAMAVSPQEVKPAPVPSKASPQPKQPPVISVNKPENPAVAAPVITPTPAPIESVEKKIPVKNEPTLSMSNEANDRLIEQFFGDFDLIGVDFGSDESPVNDGSGNNDIRQPASEETQPAFVDGRLAGFEIIEDEEGYPSPQSDCSFVCNSPPVVQSSPSEAPVFAFDWNSPEFQLGEFEIGAPSTDEVQLLSNASDFDQDHSCWYCNSYNSITSLI